MGKEIRVIDLGGHFIFWGSNRALFSPPFQKFHLALEWSLNLSMGKCWKDSSRRKEGVVFIGLGGRT